MAVSIEHIVLCCAIRLMCQSFAEHRSAVAMISA
ncbi:hypothetical protein HBB04_02363 [Pseudomonas coronafaciens]|nr:hypothetical protein HBB04_02363 [Pseudomonas coronafaciens]